MKNLLTFAVLCLSILIQMTLPSSSRAQEDQAAHLKSLFQSLLDEHSAKLATQASGPQLKMDGTLDIEQAGEYYAVTLPQLSLSYPDGRTLQVGMISVNASPAGSPGEWKMTLAFPTPIIERDANGTETMRLSLGAQQVAGLWNERVKSFTKLDAKYENIRLDFPANSGFATALNAVMRFDYKEQGKGLWSGPAFFEIGGASWNLPPLKNEGAVSKLSFTALSDQFSDAILGRGLQLLSPGILRDPEFYKSANGLDLEITAEKARWTNMSTADKPRDVSLDKGLWNLKLENIKSGSMGVGVNVDFSGFSTKGAPIALAELIPAQGVLHVSGKNVPITAITPLIPATPGAAISWPLLMIQLPLVLSNSGATVQFENSHISSNDYRLGLDALVRADAKAALGTSGEGKVAFKGLDRVLSILQVKATKNMNTPSGMAYQNAAGTLEKLKAAARVETAENDFIHNFDLKLEQTGALTVNGQSLVSILNPPPPAVPAPAVQTAPQ